MLKVFVFLSHFTYQFPGCHVELLWRERGRGVKRVKKKERECGRERGGRVKG